MRLAECKQQNKIDINNFSDCNKAHSSHSIVSDDDINESQKNIVVDDNESSDNSFDDVDSTEKFNGNNQEEER